ncbi:uncharacterized protein RAG0_17508 [Rhynchosporium agropyri]|uniref:Uncharacterized protein n=1 Tax=Rhynchosporium agropyri TaxID=914238 RepID=A0A1E1LTZ4_9HELO|nr:uncharacterized protein RAG0_17508 [Rhynchosporium agropyri]
MAPPAEKYKIDGNYDLLDEYLAVIDRESRNITAEENLIKKAALATTTPAKTPGILKRETPFGVERATKSGSWIDDRAAKLAIRFTPETRDPGSRVSRTPAATDAYRLCKKEGY